MLAPMAPEPAPAQIGRAALGGALGVLGGVGTTVGVVVARARFQHEYLETAEDLIHWQSTPMIAGPAAGVVFGLAGDGAFRGSVEGSISGLVAGSVVGAGVGWLLSTQQEAPWAGGVIGGGFGLAAGGLVGGLLGWADDDTPEMDLPELLRFSVSIPVR